MLFLSSRTKIRQRNHPFLLTHICSHTGLTGPPASLNQETDNLTKQINTMIPLCIHQPLHQPAEILKALYPNLTKDQAK